MGLPWLFSLLTDIPVGALADRFGYKKTVALGLFGLSFSGFLLYGVSNFIQLFWVLVVFGVFEGLLTVAGLALVILSSPSGKENQFVGGYTTASSLGYVVGPFVGGLAVAWFGNGIPFLMFGVICLFAAFVAIILLKDGRGAQQSFFPLLRMFGKRTEYIFRKLRSSFRSAGNPFSSDVSCFLPACGASLFGRWSLFL